MMNGPMIVLINHMLMALKNVWAGHASFLEMIIFSLLGAVSMTLVAMMPPKKKGAPKAKAKVKAKAADKKGANKRKKNEEEAVEDREDEEDDPENMTVEQKRKLMSNLAGQLKNAQAKMEKHKSGDKVLHEDALKASHAKIDHCESYQKLKPGDPEKQ